MNNLDNYSIAAASEIGLGLDYIYAKKINSKGELPERESLEIISSLIRSEPHFIKKNTRQNSVCIVILGGGANGYLFNLLDSLLLQRTYYHVDLFLIPYFNDLENIDQLRNVPWLNIPYEDGEFSQNLFSVLQQTEAEKIIFITQYERLANGAIDELCMPFGVDAGVGAVGAKMMGVGYKIWEAGGVCGVGSYGRGLDLDHPSCGFAREVNTFSGAFCVEKNTFKSFYSQSNGYVTKYFDFFEFFHQVELGGLKNLYMPTASSVWYGPGSRTEVDDWEVVGNVFIDLQKLKNKFPQLYNSNATTKKRSKQLLYIDIFVPDAHSDAGSITCINILKALSSEGWQITFMPTIAKNPSMRTSKELSRLGVKVLYEPYLSHFDNLPVICPDGFDLIFGARVTAIASLLDGMNKIYPHAPLIFFNVDLHYLRMMREAESKNSLKLYFDAIMTKREEIKCFEAANCSIIHTKDERDLILAELPNSNLIELPYFPEIRRSNVRFQDRTDIMFLGGYDHLPNVDAVMFFVYEVWPLIKKKLHKKSRFIIVGSKPTKEILDLASEDIIVTGQVPELQEYFDTSRIFVAPLRYGAGVKGKVLTALANGLPTVGTTIASEGIDLTHGVNYLTANTPLELADSITQLFHDENLWAGMQNSGYEFIADLSSKTSYKNILNAAIAIAKEDLIKRLSD